MVPMNKRIVTAFAATTTVVILLISLLHSSRGVPLYAGPGAKGSIRMASATGRKCANPTVVRMNRRNAQTGITKGSYYITNDTWNAQRYQGLSQALYVCSYNSWYAIATMNNDSGDGAVKTSPNVQETWYPTPTRLSRWESITSRFSDVPPGTGPSYGSWEFEYDIWLNGLADSKSTEVMIWTYNNGRTPAGSPSGSFSHAGQTYDVFRRSPPYQYVAFVDRSYRLSGQVSLLAFINYVISKGWIPKSSTLYQVCNGVELVSTNSKPEKFSINNFSVNLKAFS
jgi:hypothetical protein